jgi:hypothetical protein
VRGSVQNPSVIIEKIPIERQHPVLLQSRIQFVNFRFESCRVRCTEFGSCVTDFFPLALSASSLCRSLAACT